MSGVPNHRKSHRINGIRDEHPFGIEWLRRHLGSDYRVHVIEFDDLHPMHIDATLVPLAPGKVLVNPERVHSLPDLFNGWDVLKAPEPVHFPDERHYMSASGSA